MEWTRGSIIGRGSTATVSIAMEVRSGDLFAVKSADIWLSKSLQKEQSFLSKLNSPYIVKYRGFDIRTEYDQPVYNLFMEYIPQGTLYDAIQRQGGCLEESAIKSYTRQILQGLEYLHANGLAHCDIKSQNILMGKKNVKIADLGCARFVERAAGNGDSDAGKVTFSGTPMFMAPEVLRAEEQGFEADLWSLGCTVIEMATGKSPWLDLGDVVSALYRIGFSDDVPEFPTWFSEKARDFLSICFRKEPKQRRTARELLQHPFLEDSDSQSDDQVVDELFMTTPNSVLDQSLWDSFGVDDTGSENPIREGSSSFSNSAAARLEELIGATMNPSASNLTNWTWDEDWIEVRSHNSEENNGLLLPTNELPLACSSSTNREEELGRLVFGEDFLVKFSFENLNVAFVMTYEIMQNVILFCNTNFKRHIMKFFFFNFNVFFGLLSEACKSLFIFVLLHKRVYFFFFFSNYTFPAALIFHGNQADQ